MIYRTSLPLLVFLFLSLLQGEVLARDYSALVVEPQSGRVLYENFADELRHPASITKMMTLYLVFEALERGNVTLNTPFDISRNAVLRPPSRLGLTPGDTLSVEDAILALVTRSANDAATVIAENLGGTESSFAAMMTAKARALGMRDTLFKNASGLPDPDQVTTARDMYKLGRALISDFPRYYPYFSTPRFYYRGQSFDNHNHLMETYSGMDGIKTGFINASGFNLVASARRGGNRLIGVVFGGPSAVRRDRHMREILDDGFAQMNGAAPREIVAEFERAPMPRGRSLQDLELDSPTLSFGSPRHFKAPRVMGEPSRKSANQKNQKGLLAPSAKGGRLPSPSAKSKAASKNNHSPAPPIVSAPKHGAHQTLPPKAGSKTKSSAPPSKSACKTSGGHCSGR